jgi:hypothetical protein
MRNKGVLLVLFMCFLGSSSAIAQGENLESKKGRTKKQTLGFNYGFGIERRMTAFQRVHEIDNFNEPGRGEFTGYLHSVNLFHSYQADSWIRIRTQLGLNNSAYEDYVRYGLDYRDINGDRVQVYSRGSHFNTFIDLNVYLELDLLYKNPDDALLLSLGGAFAFFNRRDQFIETTAISQEQINTINYSRSGFIAKYAIGLAWEEFVTKNWGYRIGIMTTPYYDFEPSTLRLTEILYQGQRQADVEINKGNDVLGEPYSEKIRYLGGQIQVGILYRL